MRKVYEADNYIDAQIARGWLEAAGLSVLLAGEHLGGAMGELPAFGLHSLWVPDEQQSAAEAVLAELADERAANLADSRAEQDDAARTDDPDVLRA